MTWEGKFAQAWIGYDGASGYTYDGHPLNYGTGELYGEPHLFSAPSKESIHIAILALAVYGNELALKFTGGKEETLRVLKLKMDGYMQFNETFPGYGCFTPWVGFNSNGTFAPLDSWSTPYYQVPGLDNGEWFWSLFAAALALDRAGESDLAQRYYSYIECQKKNAKTIFYRGNGLVSATVYINDAFKAPTADNYMHREGYLNDPYEGETLTQMLYLFSDWDTEEERDLLWVEKRNLFQKADFIIKDGYSVSKVVVQKGWWFSTHEQWKALVMPYIDDDLPMVKKVFRNAEVARTWDAVLSNSPGLLASINDVTDGSQNIPDYISAAGVQSVAFEEVARRDVITPYGSYGLMLTNLTVGLCWYNNMIRAPRMQSSYGSTEAINVNGTEICPLTTWDSKVTTVLAMLGGIGPLVKEGLKEEKDNTHGNSYNRFVYIVSREHRLLFGESYLPGEDLPLHLPLIEVPQVLSDWKLSCL